MNEQWNALSEKVADLSVRERAILLGVACIVVLALWFQIWLSPWLDQSSQIQQRQLQAEQSIGSLNVSLEALSQRLKENPNLPLQEEAERLNQALEALDQDIEAQLAHLLSPAEMVSVMRKVLSDYKGLSLIAAKNLPVELIDLSASAQAGETEEQNASGDATIYTHGLQLQLKGSYFQTLQFLQHLETIDGK